MNLFRNKSKIAGAGVVLVLTAWATGRAQDQREKPKTIDALIYNCSDGDTCRVGVADGLWFNVRLAGIDAPEVPHGKKKPGQPLGSEAKDFLNHAIKGQTVKLAQTDLDPYNRPVVELADATGSVNLRLVAEGLAEAYRGPAKRLDRDPFFAAEAEAKKAKKGIWGLKDYVPPGDYRKSVK